GGHGHLGVLESQRECRPRRQGIQQVVSRWNQHRPMTAPRRVLTALLSLASLVAMSGCAASALQQARLADDLRDYDVAVAQYTAAVRSMPRSQEAQAGLDRAKTRASEAHLLRGRDYFARGRYEDAQVELQLATELNPLNTAAEKELRTVRAALRARLA